jgi:hypothetical protein
VLAIDSGEALFIKYTQLYKLIHSNTQKQYKNWIVGCGHCCLVATYCDAILSHNHKNINCFFKKLKCKTIESVLPHNSALAGQKATLWGVSAGVRDFLGLHRKLLRILRGSIYNRQKGVDGLLPSLGYTSLQSFQHDKT